MSAPARLRQDYNTLKGEPISGIEAEPLPTNILEWHYVFRGPKSTPFEGGFYHGKLIFPEEYPFKPPAIFMLTPNGRFKSTKICLNISDFHPESWKPVWNVSAILLGLLSFMTDDTCKTACKTPDHVKIDFAMSSLEFNLQDKDFCELFPHIAIEMRTILEMEKEDLQEEKMTDGENRPKDEI